MLSKQKLKLIHHLSKRRYREKYNKIFIEGVRIIKQSLELDQQFDYIYVTNSAERNPDINKLLQLCLHSHIERISNEEAKIISQTENPQGIFALFCPHFPKIDNFYLGLFIDRIQDCGNLGTIIRTAEAAGIRKIFLNKGTADILNPKTVRASMGAIFNIDYEYVKKTFEKIVELKQQGYKFFASTLSNGIIYNKIDKRDKKRILVIGNEARGIQPDIIELADVRIRIPIYGKIESLNVSAAAAILIYNFID